MLTLLSSLPGLPGFPVAKTAQPGVNVPGTRRGEHWQRAAQCQWTPGSGAAEFWAKEWRLAPFTHNNLATVADQIDYRGTVNQRVNALLAAYPNADPKGWGESGAQVMAVLDSGEAIRQAINRLNNLYEAIKISEWANTEISGINDDATKNLPAIELAKGVANSLTVINGFPFVGVAFSPGQLSERC